MMIFQNRPFFVSVEIFWLVLEIQGKRSGIPTCLWPSVAANAEVWVSSFAWWNESAKTDAESVATKKLEKQNNGSRN